MTWQSRHPWRSQNDPPDEWDLVYRDTGYSWCRPCEEYHRPPECDIKEDGSTDSPWERDVIEVGQVVEKSPSGKNVFGQEER